MLGNQISGIQMSKRISSSSINGRHIIIFETVKTINILQFYARQMIMTTECMFRLLILLTISVPLHSFKFIAALQHNAGKSNRAPLLLKHNLKAGHGAGKPTSRVIDEACERFAFMMTSTGTTFVPEAAVSRCICT